VSGDNGPPVIDAHPVHAELAARMRARPGMVVIDLGCGPGVTLAAVAALCPTAVLVGIDLSQDALRDAATWLGRRHLMVRADATRGLPLADRSVDVVVSHNMLELVADPVAVMAEAGRVLRPERGRAVWSHTDFAALVVHGADPTLTGRICAAYAFLPQPWMGHIDAEIARHLPHLARQAGFRLVSLDAHVLTALTLDAHARRRIEEIAAVVRGQASRGQTDLTAVEVDTWYAQLTRAHQEGRFCFTETALIAVTATAPVGQ
jgi:ubiquinone/menaquinone biosynthesis C-methylase UbiE